MKQLTFRVVLILSILFGLFAGPAASPAAAREAGPSLVEVAPDLPAAGVNSLILDENFDYGTTSGNLTAITTNWTAYSGGGTNPIQYVTSGLSFPDYPSSDVGGAATFTINGEDDIRSIGSQASGDLYYSALVQVTTASATGDYFLLFSKSTSLFAGRLYVHDVSGKPQFGVASMSAPTWGTATFDYSTTYLVVVHYSMTTGTSLVYILDACTASEPVDAYATSTGTPNSPLIGIAIRQGTAANNVSGKVDGIRVGTTWADTVSCSTSSPANLEIAKSVYPSEISISEMVNYTVTLTNTGGTDATGVLLTDTLPAEVDFGAWIQNPEGTEVISDVVTFAGNVPAGGTAEFVFSVNHMGDEGDVVTNVAQFAGAGQTGSAEATFTVLDSTPDITFVYHDLEDVVLPGEQVYLAGDFNGWSTTATPMTADANNETFTVTIPYAGDTYTYKYIVKSSGDQWNWLQTNNRSYTVSGTAVVDDYRAVVVGWAKLQWPATLTVTVGQPTDPVYGRVFITDITPGTGEGRGIQAEVGYGTETDPAAWSWSAMSYNSPAEPEEEWMGTMLPSAPGTFYYAVRFDGNWGIGNPNAGWFYGDLDSSPFSLDQAGVMTANQIDIGITKECPPSPVEPGATLTYSLSYEVASDPLDNVIITDTLPIDVSYISDTSGVTPSQPTPGTLVWNLGTVAASGSFTVQADLSDNPTEYFLTNHASITASMDAVPGNNASSCTNTRTGALSIYNIQYTTDPGVPPYAYPNTYPSPFLGQTITTAGTVCTVEGRYVFLAEAAGPWHAVIAYLAYNQPAPEIGMKVAVTGQVQEYYGLTELGNPSFTTLAPGDPVCGTTLVDTLSAPSGNSALSEPLESVMVEYQMATITSITSANYNAFTDPAGGTGHWGTYGYFPSPRPAVGTQYEYIRGPLVPYNSTDYRVMPATAADAKLLDILPPSVLSTDPINGAADVNIYKPITAVFSEDMDPATINTGTFIITGPSGDVVGTVIYDAATFTAKFTPSVELPASTAFTARLTTGVKDTTGNPLSSDFTWTFTTGIADTTAPQITARVPAAGSTDALLNTDVVITFSEELDPGTILASNFTLTGPFGAVPWSAVSYDSTLHQVTLNPSGMLLPTTLYSVSISAAVTDWAGLSIPVDQRSWSFTTQAEPPMFAFHGDLHNHTSYSDGSGTPQQAFTIGRQNGLEFMAITDHSYAIDDGEWTDTMNQAEAFNDPGDFVTLRGFEYTQGGEGHANVYNTVRHAVRTDTTSSCTMCDYTPGFEQGATVEGFYHWLSITGTVALDGSGTLLEFNHPGWINFNDWKYHPEVEATAQLEEVGNGWGSSYVFSWDEFIRSLDYGWTVGAANNTDNHTMEWGAIGPNRTGVVMAGLTRDDLMEALNARRTFATEDSNADLFFKANGYWMGSEMPNTGSLSFHAWGDDPDGELIDSVELVTADGQVVASIQPNTSSFDWSFDQTITPGVHYYLILVTEADGDRVVSSPVWTTGVEDVRITDLTIQPSLPTIYNPNLLSARVTNRGASAQTVTVTFKANDVVIGSQTVTVNPCTVGPCSDAYATISWQPLVVGPVEIIASLSGAPVGDNPDDNTRSLSLEVTDQHIPLVLIDMGHNNIGVDPHGISQFVNDLTLHGYNVLFNLDQITASDLPTDTVKLLIINAYGPAQLAPAEMQAIGGYVAAGGSIWLNGMSDYTGKVFWANTIANRMNDLVAEIEASSGQLVPVRFNDDEVLDGDDNNGYPFGVLWHNFPVSDTTGVGMNVLWLGSWSDASLVDSTHGALTQSDLGSNGFLMVRGDLDPGSTGGDLNRTSNTDADGGGDAYIYPADIPLAGGAGYELNGTGGRLFFYGDSNDPYNVFAYVSGDGKQGELFNLETVMWLLGEPLQLKTVAGARIDPELDDTPDNLNKLVWVEGKVTAGYGEFFDVLYVQDDTGGITVFAPAGNASGAVDPEFNRGDCVRVVGTIDQYNGDTEIQFFETEQVHVIQVACTPAEEMAVSGSLPLGLSTADAALEANEGWLVVVTGTVTAKTGVDTVWLDDGSGPVRLFLDGYNGTWDDVTVGDRLMVAGMASEDGFGSRIRVRNHNMHPTLPDDVVKLPQVYKQVTPQADVPLGGVVTYTLTISNVASVALTGIQLTDILPDAVDFGGWVLQNGAAASDDVVTWAGSLPPQSETSFIFTATVSNDPIYYGQTVVNTASFTSENAGSTFSQAEFTVESEPLIPLVTISKFVVPETDVPLGGAVLYTVLLQNIGNSTASGVSLEDILPSEVDFGGWLVNPGAVVVDDIITWNGDVPVGPMPFVFTATVGTDPSFYGITVTNTASYDFGFLSGSADASFVIADETLAPDLSLNKFVTPDLDVPLGSVVTYTLALANLGNGDALGVTLEDILPAEVDFGEWIFQGGAQVSNDVISWSGDITAFNGNLISFTAVVSTDPQLYGQTVTNTGSYESANAGSGSASAEFVIETEPLEPILTIAKQVTPAENVSLGGVVTYTLTLVNSGNGDATGVILEDVLPIEVDFGEWVLQSGALVYNDVITWDGVVAADSTVTISFTAVVGTDPAFYGQTVTNTAEFASDNAGSGSASASFVVQEEPQPVFFKLYLPIILKNP